MKNFGMFAEIAPTTETMPSEAYSETQNLAVQEEEPGFFESLWDNTKDAASSAWDSWSELVTVDPEFYEQIASEVKTGFESSVFNDFIEEGKAVWNAGYDYAVDKVHEAQKAMQQAISAKETLDDMISWMPEGPAKDKIIEQRNEASGFFENYIIPAWQKFAPLVGLSDDPSSAYDSTPMGGYVKTPMGALPAIALGAAAVTGALAVIYVANQYFSMIDDIRNDPSLTQSQKAQLLSSFTPAGVLQGLGALKWPMIIGGVALSLFAVAKIIGKRPKQATMENK